MPAAAPIQCWLPQAIPAALFLHSLLLPLLPLLLLQQLQLHPCCMTADCMRRCHALRCVNA